MNILLSAVGRRVEIASSLKKECDINKINLYVADIDTNAIVLHAMPIKDVFIYKDFSEYEKFCEDKKIDYILSLNDKELNWLNSCLMGSSTTKLFHPIQLIEICKDKFFTYKTLKELPIHETHETKNIKDFYKKEWIIKDRCGSAGSGFRETFEKEFNKETEVIQEKLKGKEYNVSAYFDYYSHKLIDCFMCEKISMRAGESDRVKTIINDDIYNVMKKFSEYGFFGFVDVDLFITDKNEIKIIDINVRIGGGYPFATMNNKNYFKYFINNILGKKNEVEDWKNYLPGFICSKGNAYFSWQEGELEFKKELF